MSTRMKRYIGCSFFPLWMAWLICAEDNTYHAMLERFENNTNCNEGMIANVDSFTYRALVWTSGAADLNLWPKLVDFQMGTGPNGAFNTVCTVDLSHCHNTLYCWCTFVIHTRYSVVMRRPATQFNSGKNIRIAWYNHDRSLLVKGDIARVPRVYDVKKIVTALYVNGEAINHTSPSCSFNLMPGRNTIDYCCVTAPSPCVARIRKILGNVVDTGTPCANITTNDHPLTKYLLGLTICGRQYWHLFSCLGSYVMCPSGQSLFVNLSSSGPASVGGSAVVTCTWENTCHKKTWEWQVTSSAGWSYKYHPQLKAGVASVVKERMTFRSSNMSGTSGSIQVNIQNLTCQDSGHLLCSGKYSDNSSETQSSAFLLIGKRSETPFMSYLSPFKDQFLEGLERQSTLKLGCSARLWMKDKIIWQKYLNDSEEGETIDESVSTLRQLSEQPVICTVRLENILSVTVTEEDDGAYWACFVVNDNYHTMMSANSSNSPSDLCARTDLAKILYGVKSVTIAQDPPVLFSGQTLVLDCQADGCPSPSYKWSREGQTPIPGSTTDASGQRLTIASVQPGDSGFYKCTAWNVIHGRPFTAQKDIRVTVSPESSSNDTNLQKNESRRSASDSENPDRVEYLVWLLAGIALFTVCVVLCVTLCLRRNKPKFDIQPSEQGIPDKMQVFGEEKNEYSTTSTIRTESEV